MADNYQIMSQRPDVQISPAGLGFEDVWIITYKVTSGPSRGTVGTVTVDNAGHTADNVKRVIEDKIANLDAIAGL